MLKIKLTRLGKKAEPRYRIVVNECREKRDGQCIAELGYYHPAEQPKKLQLDLVAYEEWLKKGAQPTATVAFIYGIAKAGKGFPEKKTKLSKKAKAKLEAAAAVKAEEKVAEEQTVKTETAPATT